MAIFDKAQAYLEEVSSTLQYYREQIETVRTALVNTGVDMSKFKNYPYGFQSSPSADNLFDAVVRIIDFEVKLSIKTAEATDVINQLSDTSQRRILISLYVENGKMSEISKTLNCSMRNIFRLKTKAMVQLSKFI